MTVIAEGNDINLRDRQKSDVDTFIYWQTHGEWRLLDAPWEGVHTSLTEEYKAEFCKRFLDSCNEELSLPRTTAVIVTKDDYPLGWVNRYGEERSPEMWMVGIDICEDDALNRGLGTEALELWVDYLFENSTVQSIGLDTWSLNPRMSHVAEKLGFTFEGIQREVVQWEGRWLDMIHFGLLRSEWRKTG